MLFCEGAHATAVRSTDLILVDLGGLEAGRRVGVDTKAGFDFLELSIGTTVGPYFIMSFFNIDRLIEDFAPLNNG